MTRESQKTSERRHLECFIKAMGEDAPAPASEFDDSENPDFLLQHPQGDCLGVELAALHHPGVTRGDLSLRHKEGIMESVCGKLVSISTKSNVPPAGRQNEPYAMRCTQATWVQARPHRRRPI